MGVFGCCLVPFVIQLDLDSTGHLMKRKMQIFLLLLQYYLHMYICMHTKNKVNDQWVNSLFPYEFKKKQCKFFSNEKNR